MDVLVEEACVKKAMAEMERQVFYEHAEEKLTAQFRAVWQSLHLEI